jgi:AbrB family looped-hinge helix DNA binding protein
MARAVVSTKFQVVIPKEIRTEVHLESGEVVEVIAKGGIISLVPDRPLAKLRGFLKGMKTTGIREKSDRL